MNLLLYISCNMTLIYFYNYVYFKEKVHSGHKQSHNPNVYM